MPYSHEFNEKKLTSKETERDIDEVSQWRSQDDAGTSSSGGGRDIDRFFSFIRDMHLEEAREFRRAGYNRQEPGVDPELVTQLRNEVARAQASISVHTPTGGPLGTTWLQEQLRQIADFTAMLTDGQLRDWVGHVLSGNGREGAGWKKSDAQSLVRRLESTLQTLIRVVHTLCAMDDYSTPEKRCEMLVREFMDAFSASDEKKVIQALEKMTSDAAGSAAWSSLMAARKRAWENGTFGAMRDAIKQEAKKAREKESAETLLKDSQRFFGDIAGYLEALSRDFKTALVNLNPGSSPRGIPPVMNDNAASLIQSPPLSQKVKHAVTEGRVTARMVTAQVNKALSRAKGYFSGDYTLRERLQARYTSERYVAATAKKREQVIAGSIIRSILWQWQQPAIKIEYAGGALLSKIKELKKINAMFSPETMAPGSTNEPEGNDIPVHRSGKDDLLAQARKWVHDGIEQDNPESQRTAKLAALTQLLDADIGNARKLAGRMGDTEESIQGLLIRLRYTVLKMQPASGDLRNLETLLPEIASNLAASVAALNEALREADNPGRNFSEAGRLVKQAVLLAATVNQEISAASAKLTGLVLDDHSRSARLARHWAMLAREQHPDNRVLPDAWQIHDALKKHGLAEGVVSEGDPEGYLFATRLAAEFENVRNDELRLPMSPEQYTALEKGLVEYIVKWGQSRVSSGVTGFVFELSFDAATFSIKPVQLGFKVVKALIKIPYKVSKVNNYIMPGQDKPYKAIYGMLGKKLKQLGFSLIMSPVPGVIKPVIGLATTTGAFAYNEYIESSENTFSAIYGRVAEGQKSEQIKMTSPGGMAADVLMYGASGVAGNVAKSVIKPGVSGLGGFPERGWREHENSGGSKIDDISYIDDDTDIDYDLGNKTAHLSGHENYAEGARQEQQAGLINLSENTTQDEFLQRRVTRGIKQTQLQPLIPEEPVASTAESFSFPWLKPHERDGKERTQSQAMVMRRLLRQSKSTGYKPESLLQKEIDRAEARIKELKSQQGESNKSLREQRAGGRLSGERLRTFMINKNDYVRALGQDILNEENNIYDAKVLQTLLNVPQARRYNFENKTYENLSESEKNAAYVYAMKNVLRQIEADTSLPQLARENAGLALEGENVIVPADIYFRKLNNTFFLPDVPGSKYGVLIRLNSQEPYRRIRNASDLPGDIKDDMPLDSDKHQPYNVSLPGKGNAGWRYLREFTALGVLENIQPPQDDGLMSDSAEDWYRRHFNSDGQQLMDVTLAAVRLRSATEQDYRNKGKNITNEILMKKAKDDVKIFDLFERAAVIDYSRLDLGDIARPGSGLARIVQKVASDWREHNVRELISGLQLAERGGGYIDMGFDIVKMLIPGGGSISIVQTLASIADKLNKGKEQDPLEITALLASLLTRSKVDARIAKLSPELGRGAKDFITVGGLVIDAVQFGRGVQVAMQTGDPLAVLQAFLDAGMGLNNAYKATKSLSSEQVRIKKIEDVASLQQLKTLESTRKADLSDSSLKVREFMVGDKRLRGRINKGVLEVRNDLGQWEKRNSFYLLVYRLQNAGGVSQDTPADSNLGLKLPKTKGGGNQQQALHEAAKAEEQRLRPALPDSAGSSSTTSTASDSSRSSLAQQPVSRDKKRKKVTAGPKVKAGAKADSAGPSSTKSMVADRPTAEPTNQPLRSSRVTKAEKLYNDALINYGPLPETNSAQIALKKAKERLAILETTEKNRTKTGKKLIDDRAVKAFEASRKEIQDEIEKCQKSAVKEIEKYWIRKVDPKSYMVLPSLPSNDGKQIALEKATENLSELKQSKKLLNNKGNPIILKDLDDKITKAIDEEIKCKKAVKERIVKFNEEYNSILKLSGHDREIIKKYVTSAYSNMNKKLRGQKVDSKSSPEEIEKMIEYFDDALRNIPDYSQVVYRGAGMHKNAKRLIQLAVLNKKELYISDRGYLSASLDKKVADTFKKNAMNGTDAEGDPLALYVMEIKMAHGKPMMMNEVNQNISEKEVLIPRGTVMKLEGSSDGRDGFNVKLTEVDANVSSVLNLVTGEMDTVPAVPGNAR